MVGFNDILNVSIYGLMNFLVFFLLIVSAVKTKETELEPNCKKGFSKFFILFLIFLMFSTFFDLVYLAIALISGGNDLIPVPKMDVCPSFITYYLWGIKEGLVFLNLFIALILLFTSMEINLFNKKSKGKFGIFAVVLLCGSFPLVVTKIIMYYISFYIDFYIINVIISVITNFNYFLIAVAILILLRKTSKENPSLRIYSKPLFAGVVLLFIIRPLILPIFKILHLVIGFSRQSIYDDSNLRVILGLFYLSSLIFIIGIILLTKGALKTMSTPLIFSREKNTKGIQ